MSFNKQVYFKNSDMLNLVKQFLDKQNNFSDSIMYLIEKEIAFNGIRNLGNYIPQVRTKEYWENFIKANNISNASSFDVLNSSFENSSFENSSNNPVVSDSQPEVSGPSPFRENSSKSVNEIEIPSCYDD